MKTLDLVIRYTDDLIHPMHAFVCESPFVEREVLLEGSVVEGTRTLFFFVEGDREAYRDALTSRPDVADYDIAAEGPNGFYLYVRGANRDVEADLFAAFERETVVVVPPIEFRSDRTMHMTLVGPSEDLQGVLDDLPDDLTVDVRYVGAFSGRGGTALTDRQREAVMAAWANGYYEVPREGDIEAVAADLDCAVSTASALLRRAERRLVGDALGERL